MFRLGLAIALTIAICAPAGWAQQGPYKILKTAKVCGDGGFDYVNVDVENRRLYIARTGRTPRVNVYNLDTLEPVGEVMTTNAHGAVIDAKTNHGFATSKPITMFDSKTLANIKTIDVQGNPDGAFFDPSNQRAYILSHQSPHVTVIDSNDGSIVKTFDIGGQPEQAAGDGKGHLYIDVEARTTSRWWIRRRSRLPGTMMCPEKAAHAPGSRWTQRTGFFLQRAAIHPTW